MEKQVLSIEQMRELIKLGIDTSKASMFWHPAFYRNNGILDYDRYEDIPRIKLENNYNLEYDIPTFTLQDCIEMLPNTIEWKGKIYWFSVFINGMGNKMFGYRDSELWALEFKSFSINGAFNLLKWCKQNKYI